MSFCSSYGLLQNGLLNRILITLKAFHKIQRKIFSDSLVQFSRQTQAPVKMQKLWIQIGLFQKSFKTLWINVTRLKGAAMLNETNILQKNQQLLNQQKTSKQKMVGGQAPHLKKTLNIFFKNVSIFKEKINFNFFFKSVQIHMKDTDQLNQKKIQISDFYFQISGHFLVIFVLKSPQFSMNFHNSSKNKNWKIDFSFVSAYCASSIKTGSKLRGGREREGGEEQSAYPQLGQGPGLHCILS